MEFRGNCALWVVRRRGRSAEETFYCFASVTFSFPLKATNHFQPTGRGRQTRLVYGYLGAHLNVNEARGGDTPSACLLLGEAVAAPATC